MSKDDEQEKRALRDTTRPELRPSWGVSRDNAPKGAPGIEWGDRGVPVPTPGGTGTRRKGGLFKNGLQGLAHNPQPEMPPSAPQKMSGLFSEKARETYESRANRVLMGDPNAPAPGPSASTNARIDPDKLDQKPVFRRKGRDDPDRGR